MAPNIRLVISESTAVAGSPRLSLYLQNLANVRI